MSASDHANTRARLELLNRLTIADACARVSACSTHARLRLLVCAASSRLLLIDIRARVNSALLTANILRRAVRLHLLFTLDGARAAHAHRSSRLLLSLLHLLVATVHATLVVDLTTISALQHGRCQSSVNILINILLLHERALLIIVVNGHLRWDVLCVRVLKLLITYRVEALKHVHEH